MKPRSFFALLILSSASARAAEHPHRAIVIQDKAFVFDEPNELGNALRKLYQGEVVEIAEWLTTPSGTRWAKVRLGRERLGFVEAARLEKSDGITYGEWEPPRVLRDERPLSVALRVMGDTYGGALQLRYLPFSRMGFALGAGSVLDKGKMNGTSLSSSLYIVPALWNLSPIIEAGVTRLSYHRSTSILRVTALQASVQLEWITRFGVFVGAGATYLRSADVEVAVDYGNARRESMTLEKYGVLEPSEGGLLQELKPVFTLGYAF